MACDRIAPFDFDETLKRAGREEAASLQRGAMFMTAEHIRTTYRLVVEFKRAGAG